MYTRFVKNASLLWTAKVASILLSLFISARLARYLGVEGYGLYGYVYSLSHLLLVPTNLKMGTTLVREFSRQEDRRQRSRLLGASLSVRMMLSSVGILIVVLLAVIGDYEAEFAWSLIICSLSFVCLFFTQILLSVFRSAEKMEYELGISILNTSLYAVLVALITWLDLGLVLVFACKLIAELVPLIVAAYIVVTRFQAPIFQRVSRLSLSIARMSIPFGISLVARQTYVQLGTILLKILAGEAAVGLLRPASQLYENLGMFPLYASIAVYPFLSRKAQGTDRKYFSERYHELFKYFLAGSLGVSVALLAMGDEIVVSVFSKDFAASSLPLKILAWAMPCMFLNQLLGHLLASIDKQGQEALNYVIVVFAFLGMLLALIPSMSYVGVAVAMVISEALLFFLNYYSASKFTGRMPFGGIGRSILAFCVAAAALFVLSDRVYWLVPFLVAELVYLMALLICGAFSKQEIIAFAGEFHRLSVSLLKK